MKKTKKKKKSELLVKILKNTIKHWLIFCSYKIKVKPKAKKRRGKTRG